MAEDANEVRWEFLRPREMEQAMAACPTAYVPLGTLEWHGVHNALGLDALKAHRLCVMAAERFGGVVLPPLFGGMGGMDEPYTVVIEPEHSLHSVIMEQWLRRTFQELKRIGFRAVITLTGHYGASQQIAVRETAVRESQRLDIPILGTPEYWLALDHDYFGDHAGVYETSLMLYMMPNLVDLSRLEGYPPYQGVGGGDPKRESSPELGMRIAETIVERLGQLAASMPVWDGAQRAAFVRAEQALVNYQVECAGRTGQVWSGWQDLHRFVPYSTLLVEERFGEIAALVAALAAP